MKQFLSPLSFVSFSSSLSCCRLSFQFPSTFERSIMNGTLKDRQLKSSSEFRALFSRPFYDAAKIKGPVINPHLLGVLKPWNPALKRISSRYRRPRCCPELRDRTTDDFYTFMTMLEMFRRLFMAIRSLYSQVKEICGVSDSPRTVGKYSTFFFRTRVSQKCQRSRLKILAHAMCTMLFLS